MGERLVVGELMLVRLVDVEGRERLVEVKNCLGDFSMGAKGWCEGGGVCYVRKSVVWIHLDVVVAIVADDYCIGPSSMPCGCGQDAAHSAIHHSSGW